MKLNIAMSAVAALLLSSLALADAAPAPVTPPTTTPPVAAACPDLTGTYTCKSNDGKDASLSIAMETINNQTVYTLTQDNQATQLPTDNVEYKIEDKANNITGTVRFVCEASAFNQYLKGQKTDGTTTVVQTWDLEQSISLAADATKSLTVGVKGTMTDHGKANPVAQTSTCPRATK